MGGTAEILGVYSVESEKDQPRRGDDLLCYCDEGVTYDAFSRAVANAPNLDFDAICTSVKVGRRCTACLLNAEAQFYEASKDRGSIQSTEEKGSRYLVERKAGTTWQSYKRAAYAFVDSILPPLSMPRVEIAPIVVGPGVTTVVSLSNNYPHAIGNRSATQRVRVRCRDADGQVFRESSHSVAPGARLDLDVSAGMPLKANDGSCGLAVGSCWIFMDSVGAGCMGSTRPHFKIVTPSAVTALHTQRANGPESHFVTASWNSEPPERQFIVHLNVKNRAVETTIEIEPLGVHRDQARTFTRSLPPLGTDVFELPLTRQNPGAAGYFALHSRADTLVRRLLLVAADGLTRISADHI